MTDLRLNQGAPSLPGSFKPVTRNDLINIDTTVKKLKKESGGNTIGIFSQDMEVFHTPDNQPFVEVRVGNHREVHKVKSQAVRRMVMQDAYKSTGKPVSTDELSSSLLLLESQAMFDGETREVSLRLAEHDGKIIYDLTNKDWEVVVIDKDGFGVEKNSPVKFRRGQGMIPNVTPSADGSIEKLRPYLNIANRRQWILIVMSIIGAFHPTGPYVVLVIQGVHGCAKTTTCKIVRSLVDPSASPLRSPINKERDLVIHSNGNWLISFDNLSGASPAFSDNICRLATGGGFSTRQLYTDEDEIVFDLKRPVLLNGIDEIATRPDLISRAVILNLPEIKPEHRKSEKEFWKRFERDRAEIMGGIFKAVSCAIKNLPNVDLKNPPRMADFAKWCCAASEALDITQEEFMDAYNSNKLEAIQLALDTDSIAIALIKLMDNQDSGRWVGTASELLESLNRYFPENYLRSRYCIATPIALSNRIRRIIENFNKASGYFIEVDNREGGSGRRLIFIFKLQESEPLSTPRDDGDSSDDTDCIKPEDLPF